MSDEVGNLPYLISQGFSPTILKRFWRNVTSDCWNWIGKRNNKGYGVIGHGGSSTKQLLAHRVSWMIHFGAIPDGMCVLHKCDNPPCVRPDHLFLGTKKDNLQDMSKKGRNRGAGRLTEDQILEIFSAIESTPHSELASRFGVGKKHIQRIATGLRWGHVTGKVRKIAGLSALTRPGS